MNIENVMHIFSSMDFSEWGIMGTLLILLQNTIASNCDTLVKWAVGIGSVLSGVIIALWLKLQSENSTHKTELSRINGEFTKEVARLNDERLKLQREHSEELREIEINNVTIMNKVIDTLNRYEGAKR